MLKRTINYTNFDGTSRSKDFYFNLTKTELVELDGEAEGGLAEALQKIVDAQDGGTLIAEFKRIILLSYGERQDDGDRFAKTPEITEAFSQSAAFDVLFMELAQDEGKAAAFITGIMPDDIKLQMQGDSDKPSNPPLMAPPAPPQT